MAVLPWGATEAHNLHLPYGTDAYLATALAERAAALAWEQNVHALVLPCIPFGVNTGQMDVPFCMNMNPSTQQAVLEDILFVLERHGINKLLIVNAHGGNSFVPVIRELSLKHKIMVCLSNWWTVCDAKAFFKEPGDHAGELETSVMMALAPEWVLPLSCAGEGASIPFRIKAMREHKVWMPRRWIYATKDTGVGNPKEATAEKGSRFVAACAKELAAFLIDFSQYDKEEDLYGNE